MTLIKMIALIKSFLAADLKKMQLAIESDRAVILSDIFRSIENVIKLLCAQNILQFLLQFRI